MLLSLLHLLLLVAAAVAADTVAVAAGEYPKNQIAHQRCCTYALESRSEPCNR